MGEALSLAALLLSAGFLDTAAAITSSHFCTAERQYRTPLPYGSQRAPTAQWTATAAGCTLLHKAGPGPYITHVTCGRIVDKGITDAANMGAAMAPAALDTLSAFFRDTGYDPGDFDRIFTGDLGQLGSRICWSWPRERDWNCTPTTATAARSFTTSSARICTAAAAAAAAAPRF